MALYRIERQRVQMIERTITSTADIEVDDDSSETEIYAAAKRRSVKWEDVDEWDIVDNTSDDFSIMARLDAEPEQVRGMPQDFGLTQNALFA